jgi:hypothetical protein
MGERISPNKKRGFPSMAVATKTKSKAAPAPVKRGRKPGQTNTAKSYSVAGLLEALRGGDIQTRRDAAKRYPLFATATADELLGSMTGISARKVENWLNSTDADEDTEEVTTAKAPSSNGHKRGPGRPPTTAKVKVAEPEEDEDSDEEEETPVRRGPGRPKGSTSKVQAKKGKVVTASNKKASKRSVEEEDDDDIESVLEDEDEEDEDEDEEEDD